MYNFRAKRCTDAPANCIFSGPVTRLLLVLCLLIKILSHASAKKKTKSLKDSNFTLLVVILSHIMAMKGLITHFLSFKANSRPLLVSPLRRKVSWSQGFNVQSTAQGHFETTTTAVLLRSLSYHLTVPKLHTRTLTYNIYHSSSVCRT